MKLGNLFLEQLPSVLRGLPLAFGRAYLVLQPAHLPLELVNALLPVEISQLVVASLCARCNPVANVTGNVLIADLPLGIEQVLVETTTLLIGALELGHELLDL